MTTLPDVMAPQEGKIDGGGLAAFMQRWMGQTQLPRKVSEEAVVRAEATFENNMQRDRDLAAMRETLRAKRTGLEEMPSNTADREERFARIQKLKNLEFDTEHFDGR